VRLGVDVHPHLGLGESPNAHSPLLVVGSDVAVQNSMNTWARWARIAASLLSLGIWLAGCSTDPSFQASGLTATSDDGGGSNPPRKHQFTVKFACVLYYIPECTLNVLGNRCVEGHDDLFTAYAVNLLNEANSEEVINYNCATNKRPPCDPDPPNDAQQISGPFTWTFVSKWLCPNDTDSGGKMTWIADDDGCQIACNHGDLWCCAALRTGLAPAFSWTEGSHVNQRVRCSYDGCDASGDASNMGTGRNQAWAWDCTADEITITEAVGDLCQPPDASVDGPTDSGTDAPSDAKTDATCSSGSAIPCAL